MKRKYGATYALYVKLRRCQFLLKKNFIPRYRKEAFAIADEIVAADPRSQFAEAAKYLKGAIPAARLTDDSDKKQIREAKEYLEKFVRENPDGLYRGEALMELGRISLECEWNAKEAEKYYKDALAYFQKSRQKRDALSMYAPLSEELKKQSEPMQKPTTLNEWKRIVYHDEDPLKLYNTGNAPAWYADDKEKECIYPLGLLAFADGKYADAWKYWSNITQLDAEQSKMDAANIPNVIMRLREVCKQREFLFSEEERKSFSNNIYCT